MQRHIIIDPATTTGFCVVDVEGDKANIVEWDYIHIDNSSKYLGDHCIKFKQQVKDLLLKNNAAGVGVEDYMARGKFVTGMNTNVAYRTAIHMASRELSLHYEILNVTEWKKWVAGSSSPSKIHKQKYGKEAAKKVFIQEALWEKYDIRFPNHSISEKTGKPVSFKYDVVDAVGQAVFYLEKYLGVNILRAAL